MNEPINIWNFIVSTNTFNFIVMALLLAFIFKKVNILRILDNAVEKVVSSIENSKSEKLSAVKKLEEASALVKNLDNEIASQLEDAKKEGDTLSLNIKKDTEEKINSIKVNAGNVILSEEKTISSRLLRDTAENAVNLAEEKIKTVLRNFPEFHNKYIEESIQELDRAEL